MIFLNEMMRCCKFADTFLSGANGVCSEIPVQQHRKSQVSQSAS